MIRLLLKTSALFLLTLPIAANAALIRTDFQFAGDGLIITDTQTGLEWLDPSLTTNVSYNDVAGGYQDFVTTLGFWIADSASVLSMIADNFDNPTTVESVQNVPKALAFFDVFGINESFFCAATIPPGECPRTIGWSMEGIGIRGIGMITIGDGALGYLISDFRSDLDFIGNIESQQAHTWLVRPRASVIEPGIAGLIGLGLAGLALARGAQRSPRRAKTRK